MKLSELTWLSDEGIAPEVVEYLRRMSWNVVTAAEAGVRGRPDGEVLAVAFSQGRAVITHDSDFGTLAIAGGQKCVGIVYLRPGHIDPAFTTATVRALVDQDPEVSPPFIIVAVRKESEVTIRVRRL